MTLALGATPHKSEPGGDDEVIPALPGAIFGLPLGGGLYKAAAHRLSGLPSVLWLVAAELGTVFAVAALTSARHGSPSGDPLLRCSRPRRHDALRPGTAYAPVSTSCPGSGADSPPVRAPV